MSGFQAQFTRAGYDRLKIELEQLKLDRVALREEVKEARELGDLRENAGYHAARQSLGILEGQIDALEKRLEDPIIVENGEGFDEVSLGIPVTIKNHATGKERVYVVVGSEEMEFTENAASEASPIGQAILGKKVGDQVAVNDSVTLEIIRIGDPVP